MLTKNFHPHKIGVIARLRNKESAYTLIELIAFLISEKFEIILEAETANFIENSALPIVSREFFGQSCDVAIVVGGDGSILNAARLVLENEIPVIGINRGRLGFLTDIHPNDMREKVLAILKGQFIAEQRFLLQAELYHNHQKYFDDIALNDVVLLPGEYVHMIEFEIYINEQLVCRQRADGQIISTPTGSTAYALSGGGPIISPSLEAILLVPMFSHTLSARPIVIDSHSEILIKLLDTNETSPAISCDGLQRISAKPSSIIKIKRLKKMLTLLHPKDYNYFETLRTKLHWQNEL